MTTTPTLREAAQQALEALEAVRANMQANAPHLSGKSWGDAATAITTLRAALAEQPAEQAEPVAWREHVEQRLHQWRASTINEDGDRVSLSDHLSDDALDDLIDYVRDEWFGPAAPPAPARQEPLTDEQITEACRGIFLSDYRSAREYDFAIARAIERAHGITAAPAEGGAA